MARSIEEKATEVLGFVEQATGIQRAALASDKSDRELDDGRALFVWCMAQVGSELDYIDLRSLVGARTVRAVARMHFRAIRRRLDSGVFNQRCTDFQALLRSVGAVPHGCA